MKNQRLQTTILGVLGFVGFFGTWQFLALGPLADTSLPYADSTLRRLVELLGESAFWSATWDTLRTSLIGFVLAAVIGIGVGLAAGLSAYVYAAIRVTVEAFKPIPPIVVLPLAAYALGPTSSMAQLLIILGLVPSLIVVTYAGVRDLDPIADDTALSYRMGPLSKTTRIVLPAAMPFVITGLRIAAFSSLLIAVMAEIVGGSPGLGSSISAARRANLSETTYALVLAVGILGFGLDRLVTAIQQWLLSWHTSVRGEGEREVRPRRFQPARALRFLDRPVANLDRRLLSMGAGKGRQPNRYLIKILEYGTPVALIAWWWFSSAASTDAFFVPLSEILSAFRQVWLFDRFGVDALPSLRNLLVGFLAGSLAGVAIGTAMALIRPLRELLEPVLALFRSIPGVAFIPIFITLLGFGTAMRIITIAVVTSFPVMIATVDGIRSLNPLLRDVAHSYQFSRTKQLTYVELPGASPRIAAGLEVALATALVVMIASELNGVTVGIGAQTILAQQSFQFPEMWAGVVLLGLLGLATNWVFKTIERQWLAWYRGATAASRAR